MTKRYDALRRQCRPAVVAQIGFSLLICFVVLLMTISSTDRDRATPRTPGASTASLAIGVTFGNSLLGLTEADLERTLDGVVAMHAKWIRVDMAWPDVQPVSSTNWTWTPLDRIVRLARARGLQVLGILTYTPTWAREPGCTAFGCPPANDAEFETYAKKVVERYSPMGVRSYEIWNEPNLPLFWSDPDPIAYRNLLARTVAGIRSVEPSSRLLFGGLAALPTNGRTISPQQFLAEVCGTGRCTGINAISYHPYTFPRLPSDTAAPLNSWQLMTKSSPDQASLRSVMKSNGLGSLKIWVTEFGVPTGTGPGGATIKPGQRRIAVSYADQAAILLDGLESAVKEQDLVGAYMVHTWTDQTSAGNLEDHFGLRTVSGSAKPAYTALRRALAR